MSRPLSPREELIRIQRVLSEGYRAEIEQSLEDRSGDLRSYQQEHDAEVATFERVSGKAELISEIVSADIVYVGDFHSLRACQRAFFRLVQDALHVRPGLCLALEAFRTADQPALDAFLAGRIKFPTLLKRVRFNERWGFHADVYENILCLARSAGLPVIGINSSGRGRPSLAQRDAHMARALARLCAEHPQRGVLVLVGELHAADCHLPTKVRELLAADGLSRPRLILFQNPEAIYWKLAELKLEQTADVVKLRDFRYALLSSTPLMMHQSYLNWLADQEELCERSHPEWADADEPDYTSQVYELVRIVAEFLGITEVALDDFSVYCVSDLNFLESLVGQGYSREQIAEIKWQVLKRESYFVLGRNVIYLASLSVDHAAEEAAHYINARCAGLTPRRLSRREDFYQRVLREALGFFGSKVIDPKRRAYELDEFSALLRTPCQPSEDRNHELYQISRHVLLHKEYERDYLAGRRRATPRYAEAWSQPAEWHLGIAHGLGYMLGDRLFKAVGWGLFERAEVKRLFFMDFKRRGDAQRIYMDLVGRLLEIPTAEAF